MQFCLMKKTSILDMAPERHDTMTQRVRYVYVDALYKFTFHHQSSSYGDRLVCAKQVAVLIPFLVLFDAHNLSFYEWKVV